MKIIYVSVGLLVNENSEILIEKNETNSSFKGLWQFPGGKVELDEPPFVALAREIKEELNVNLCPESTSPIAFVEKTTPDNKYYVVYFYLCRKWDGEVVNNIFQEIKWCGLDKIENIPFLPHNKPIIKKLCNLL